MVVWEGEGCEAFPYPDVWAGYLEGFGRVAIQANIL